jgi:hypothetical protein
MKALIVSFYMIEEMYLKLISVDFNSDVNNYNNYLRKFFISHSRGIYYREFVCS